MDAPVTPRLAAPTGRPGEYEELPMVPVAAGRSVYQAQIPTTADFEYYVEAQLGNTTLFWPAGAPASPWVASVL